MGFLSVYKRESNDVQVFDAQFHPSWPNTIVTGGLKHICFWQLCGNVLTPTIGDYGKALEVQTVLCLGFGANGITFAGALSGSVFLWQKDQLQGEIEEAHEVRYSEWYKDDQ